MAIEFTALADVFVKAGCYQNPSALHGWLAGYLASGARLETAQWLSEAQDYIELDELPVLLHNALTTFYDATLASLNGDGLDFTLLLPEDDETDIDEQVECLGHWSKGFLDGFGAAGRIQGNLPEDIAEVLEDFDAFSQIELENINDPENEKLYLELVEHARMATMVVFYSMNKSQRAKTDTLH